MSEHTVLVRQVMSIPEMEEECDACGKEGWELFHVANVMQDYSDRIVLVFKKVV